MCRNLFAQTCEQTYNANWFCLMNTQEWLFHGLCVFNFLHGAIHVYLGVCIYTYIILSCKQCYSTIPQDLSATEIVIVQWKCNCTHKCAVANGCSWLHTLVEIYTISSQQLQSISSQPYPVSNIQSQYPVIICLIIPHGVEMLHNSFTKVGFVKKNIHNVVRSLWFVIVRTQYPNSKI